MIIDKLTLTHHYHPESISYIRVHSWCCTFYGFEQMYNDMYLLLQSVSSVAQSCPTLCDPMDRSMPGLPVHHQLLEFTQTHVHWVGDAIQASHLMSSPSPPSSVFPSISVFSNESVLCIRWPNIGVSALASVLPMNIQDWFPLGWTGWISLQSKGLSRVFTVQKHQFFSIQLSL